MACVTTLRDVILNFYSCSPKVFPRVNCVITQSALFRFHVVSETLVVFLVFVCMLSFNYKTFHYVTFPEC